MTTRNKLILAAVALATSFAFGRYTVPQKIEIRHEVVTVEVEKKDTHKDQQTEQNRKTTETEITRPDGTKVRRKVTETEKKTDTEIKQTVERERDQKVTDSKVVTTFQGLSVSFIAGPNFTDLGSGYVYGGHISRPFLGPVSLGVWGLSSGHGGISLGLQF